MESIDKVSIWRVVSIRFRKVSIRRASDLGYILESGDTSLQKLREIWFTFSWWITIRNMLQMNEANEAPQIKNFKEKTTKWSVMVTYSVQIIFSFKKCSGVLQPRSWKVWCYSRNAMYLYFSFFIMLIC